MKNIHYIGAGQRTVGFFRQNKVSTHSIQQRTEELLAGCRACCAAHAGVHVFTPSRCASGWFFQALRSQLRGTAEVPEGGAPANFTGLVLLCIEAKFCKKILVGKLSPRSTQCTPLHRSLISFFSSKIAQKNLRNFCKEVNFANFAKMLMKSC